VGGEKAPDRAQTDGDAMSLAQRAADFRKRQVRLMGDQRQHGDPVRAQPRATIAAHGTRLDVTVGTQALRPSHRGAFTDVEPLRRGAGRRAPGNH
jgi:hypothetical protein